jgi:hypothetical protein
MGTVTLDMTGRVYSIRRQGAALILLIEISPTEEAQIAAAARTALPDHPSPQPQEAGAS